MHDIANSLCIVQYVAHSIDNSHHFAVPPLHFLCGASAEQMNGVISIGIIYCSLMGAVGKVTYTCDIDSDSIPCEWNVVLIK